VADVTALVPLLVVVPLAVAVTLTATARWLPDWVPDLAAILAAAAVTAISVALLLASRDHPIVYWFGGWRPVHGMPIGIAFVVEPLAAALAALAGLLTTASLVFSWRYFEDVGHLYHALVLAFLAGMVGFSLSADLFNIFVFLELMSVSAYALCGYQIHQAAVVQGAVNFAIINSLGTFTMLMGIAMVYAGTGQLNLSAIGHQLSQAPGHSPGTAVVVGFSFITVGLLVKAGAVPFHFWMSDAYAVAPAPVGALFAGVMSDLAYHTYARVYWDAFAPGFDQHAAGVIRDVLLTIAVLTALLGAVMCVLQSDLKRQIAFLTISHGGIFFAGIALLTPRGLAGATLYLITDGLLKAALFLSFAIVIKRLGSSDELALHGKGRRPLQALPMVVFLMVGLGLATLPPFGTFLSSALIYDSPGYGWLPPLMVVAAAITSGTVLRAAARIYLGWGPTHDPLLTGREKGEPEEGEPEGDESGLGLRLRMWLLTPALGLVLVAYGVAFTPSVAEDLVSAAAAQQDPVAIEQLVLHGHRTSPPQVAAYEPSRTAFAYGSGAAGGALLLAALGLWWRRLGRRVVRPVVAAARGLKAVHDGSVGDYAVWFTAGVAVLTAAWAGLLR
jgi:multicomponent Na+:H+ antiporter subunit D